MINGVVIRVLEVIMPIFSKVIGSIEEYQP